MAIVENSQSIRGFSFTEARSLIGDLNRPNPIIYWSDFLASILVGHATIVLMSFLPRLLHGSPWLWPAVIVCYLVTVLTYMRALMFIHELVHLPSDQFQGFRIVWNLLCGILFFVPSFLYYPHVDHHRRKHYGTERDGEYLPLSHNGRWMIVGFIVQALLIPLLVMARFLIIAPICWVVPGARRYIHRHASTMLVDPSYQRTDATAKLMRMVVLQEVGCFLWSIIYLSFGGLLFGQWINPFWLVAYLVAVGLLVLNELRTLGAHRWTNQGGEMSFEQQLLDTINYPHRPWFTELWGPVGTRYHAIHHLFPRLPYHNLGKAHRRLVQGLPADSPYHQATATSLTAEILSLWRRASATKPPSDPVDLERVTTN